ncbi:GlcG/HbpS family heme-binding protein [Pararhodonellum marinum]|uniref:GlcG/HbpS family heme-binding protein n=1 Tax=Pararhodonellum marinum TaxID=2755358 RepID=UPI00188F7333|nr:heme-binding protein [Pararhodonellum marinum]
MTNSKTSLIIALTLFIAFPFMAYSQGSTQPYLNLEDALRISDAAETRAKEDNWNVVIAIMDAGGHLISLKRMDGTQIGSVEIAQAKAKTAVYLKRPTKVFEDMIKQGNHHLTTLPNVTAVEGGLPIFKDGTIVGSIGISGVTSAQDGMIAEAALKAL